jgi:hypothetical protein
MAPIAEASSMQKLEARVSSSGSPQGSEMNPAWKITDAGVQVIDSHER